MSVEHVRVCDTITMFVILCSSMHLCVTVPPPRTKKLEFKGFDSSKRYLSWDEISIASREWPDLFAARFSAAQTVTPIGRGCSIRVG